MAHFKVRLDPVYKAHITENCNNIFIQYLLKESRLAAYAFMLSFIFADIANEHLYSRR